ncbi:cytochrome c oxidase assembly protein cox16 [Phytophthora cinnamomi]|uniref:cytochrome c oxidase assembly protein cox16 n=1 Tax=Phytophthora cinnamomi TaxID=4785 RepID=UPI00355968DE|nr:cytochrome c oxidase assembly protein cox16 [Phytophthora cinnamomi]
MLRTAVRRFSAAASKQHPPSARPKKHGKKKNHFATAGLPLVLFIVGGYVALTQFVGGKYEARDHLVKSQSEHMFNLEEEHKRMSKKLQLDDFELKPVPKPKDA